jgi:hypothetical protein
MARICDHKSNKSNYFLCPLIDGHKKAGSKTIRLQRATRRVLESALARTTLPAALSTTATLATLVAAAITTTAATAVTATMTATTRTPEWETTGHGRHHRDNHRELRYTTQHIGYSLNDRHLSPAHSDTALG